MADGYWPRIRDRDSAMSAVRMAGLPVFLIGATTLLFVLVTMAAMAGMDDISMPTLPFVIATPLGVGLVALGLSLRAGRAVFVPIAAALTLANAAVTLWMGPVWALPVQALAALLGLSGLRGWWWLRNNRALPFRPVIARAKCAGA